LGGGRKTYGRDTYARAIANLRALLTHDIERFALVEAAGASPLH